MNERMRRAIEIRELMNESTLYTCDSVGEERHTRFMTPDQKALAVMEDKVGYISDCFILYAIARLRCATRESISLFLRVLKDKESGLYIADMDLKAMDNRISQLLKYGLITSYISKVAVKDMPQTSHLALYCVTNDGRELMNDKLRKRIKTDTFVNLRPSVELVGYGASAYVVTRLMTSPNFVEFGEGIFKGKYCGTVRLDNELNLNINGSKVHLAVISFFFHHDTRIMTEKEFKDLKYHKLNTIRDYLLIRGSREGHKSAVVCVCENNKDMHDMAKFLVASEGFNDEQLNRIHFTSQTVMKRVKNIEDGFIHIVPYENEDKFTYEQGCDFL